MTTQEPYTGALGAFFMLGLYYSFAIFQQDIQTLGGAPIPFNLTWLGVSLPFETINRDYFDVLAIVILGFQLMISWEFSSKWFRFFILIVTFTTLRLSWTIAHHTYRFESPISTMELLFLLHLGTLLVLFSLNVFLKKSVLPIQPIKWALKTAFFRWLSGLIVFYLLLRITFILPFYLDGFYENWRITCTYLFFCYLILGWPYGFATNLLRKPLIEDRSDPLFTLLLLFDGLFKLFKGHTSTLRTTCKNRRVRIVLRDLIVKLFFVPLMITFLFNESGRIFNYINNLKLLWNTANSHQLFQQFYLTAYSSIFIMDVSLALIGYLSASRWLDNKSLSVDSTLSGWLVTVICYPPFNEVMNKILPYGQSYGQPYIIFQHDWLDIPLKIITLLGLSLYVWATMSFGLRFSNLTHRGVISRGPYRLIRHPAYIGKNIAWWAESIRSFASPLQFLFLAIWNLIYYFRAITEERHLKQDKIYRNYCQKVKYRFIPGVV